LAQKVTATTNEHLLEKIEFTTKITLTFNNIPDFKIFTLDNPNRLVIDLLNTSLQQKEYKPTLPNFASAFRYRNNQNNLRLVFDLKEQLFLQNISKNKTTLSAELISIQDKTNAIKIAEPKAKYTLRTKKKLPVVVIDAGHGGKDPGAIGIYAHTYEKNITLSYAKELAKQLKNKYKVFLTRDGDDFLSLRKRVEFARDKKADIFISLHANSAIDKNVSGFSIYTLSEKSSDKQAEILAKKENQADIIAGVNFEDTSQDIVKTLIDLSQREAKNNSAKFASQIISAMKTANINILQNTHRFAGFMVLTAPDVASVLIELGYLSNKQEEDLLNSISYKRKIAQNIAIGIENYFTQMQQ
jgi:N-acetylmuramoyl-L-alanine amidase